MEKKQETTKKKTTTILLSIGLGMVLGAIAARPGYVKRAALSSYKKVASWVGKLS